MPATVDAKGIAAGFSDGEDGWGTFMNQNLRILSAAILNGFGQDVLTTSGLIYGYRGGVGVSGAGMVNVAAGAVTLPASTTSYIVRTFAGVVTSQTSSTFADKIHLATVTTDTSNILTVVDARGVQGYSQDGTLRSRYLSTTGAAASAGAIRIANTDKLKARNAADTADIDVIEVTAANKVRVDTNGVGTELGGAVSGGAFSGTRFIAIDASLVNGALSNPLLQASAGADGTLGPTYAVFQIFPSATAGSRYVALVVGDNLGYRKLAMAASQVFIGTNPPTFVGAERLRIDGALSVNGTITLEGANSISGVGSGLTGVPQAGVTNLATDLSTLFASVAANTSAIAGKANTSHTHAAADVTSGQFPLARIDFGADLGYGSKTVNDLVGGRSAALAQPTTNSNSDLYLAVVRINDVLINLVNDMNARGYI